jgi:hypothetical protein
VISFSQYLKEHTYQEEIASTFSDDGETYDLNKIFRLTQNTPIKTLKVSELDWI